MTVELCLKIRGIHSTEISCKFLPLAIITELYTLHYRKLTLHEIRVLEINANLVENGFPVKEMIAKEKITFQNEGS